MKTVEPQAELIKGSRVIGYSGKANFSDEVLICMDGEQYECYL